MNDIVEMLMEDRNMTYSQASETIDLIMNVVEKIYEAVMKAFDYVEEEVKRYIDSGTDMTMEDWIIEEVLDKY